MSGIVYLIGAGPGDYKLITVKGRECVEKADVIVYDYLADEKILRWAKPEAELIYAGKMVNNHTLTQDEINAVLVEKGLEGKIVARLKGGDPLVFGRGGEEALALREAGIPFEFVPGVTSGISAPAYAGIPVTHRNLATSFAIVTGHENPNKPGESIHWEHLAKAVDTISFVMGVGNLPHITEELRKYGRPENTPVAVIRWGTKGEQETIVSDLAHIAEEVEKAKLQPPAIVIVGEVVALRPQLQWFDTKPLFGKKVVVTRARSKASSLVEKLESLGADVIEAPAIETVPLPMTEEMKATLEHLDEFKTLIFTSAEGVRYFFDELFKEGLDVRKLHGLKITAIGSGTAKALKGFGVLADILPANYQAESVVEALEPIVMEGEKALLVQPVVARSVIPDGLRAFGAEVEVFRMYETKQSTVGSEKLAEELALCNVDYITFTSSSTVTNTLELLGENGPALVKNAKVVAIGPITAATAYEYGVSADIVAPTFTVDAMVDAIMEDLGKKDN